MTGCVLILSVICCIHVSLAVRHGRNLIWTQRPSIRIGVARIVGIEGDPLEWVPSGEVNVRHISAPHIGWHFKSIAYNYESQTLFWSESSNRKIQGLILNGTVDTKTIFQGTSGEVNGLTVDWVSNNLYWTDAMYNWVIMVPLNPTLKDGAYKIIVKTGLDNPHGIAVFPKKGYLFWGDWGERPKIEMSDILGQNRRILVDTDIKHPRGLVVDYGDNAVYWVDSKKDTIESVEFNGNNRRVIVSNPKTNFFGIALYETYLFVTEQSSGYLQIYNKRTGKNEINYQLGYIPYGIVMYDDSVQERDSSTASCASIACGHICIHGPLNGPTCHCGDGYVLADDRKNCTLENTFVKPSHIYAIKMAICQYPANLPDMSLTNVTLDNQCFLKEKRGYQALAFQAEENTLYYSEALTKSISRIQLQQGAAAETIMKGVGNVEGMVLDWTSSNLYWTDSDQQHIMVSKSNGLYQKVIIGSDLDKPLGIAVHPRIGTLYWTDRGATPKVEYSLLDGSQRRTIMADNIISPNHLFLDYRDDKLYWSDSGMHHVRCYELSTSRIQVVYSQDQAGFFGISVYQDYLLWTDTDDSNGIHVARLDRKEKIRGVIHPQVGVSNALITYDESNQPDIDTPCSTDNGGCQQLCLHTSNITRLCACGVGYDLDDNLQTCSSDLVRDNFLLVADRYQKQIYQIDASTGSVHAISLSMHYWPTALDYDPVKEQMYWTDDKYKLIKCASLEGTKEYVVKTLASESIIDGIAVDYVNRLFFYTDTGLDTISVMSLDRPSVFKTLINTTLDEPRAIAVDSQEGRIYWTDWGKEPKIETSAMDGTDRRRIISLKTKSWPNGLVIDSAEQQLYWVDAKNDKVETASVTGSNRRTILEENKAHYFGIELMGGYLYITDWSRKYVARMPKNGSQITPVGPEPGLFARLNGICGYNASEVMMGRSVCLNTGCTHLCLPSGRSKFVCACPDDFVLEENKFTCRPKDQTTLQTTTSKTVTLPIDVTVNVRRNEPLASRQKDSGGLSGGGIVGICIFVIIALGAITVGAIFIYRRWRQSYIPHGRLVNTEDSPVDSFYRITFPNLNRDDSTTDSGIENLAYEYVEEQPIHKIQGMRND